MSILPVVDDEESYRAALVPLWVFRALLCIATAIGVWATFRFGPSWHPIVILAVAAVCATVATAIEGRRNRYRFEADLRDAGLS